MRRRRDRPIVGAIALTDVIRRTGLSAEEVQRFNPALRSRVPARATLYLPMHVAAFGRDVAFWRHPPSRGYTSVLREFVRFIHFFATSFSRN